MNVKLTFGIIFGLLLANIANAQFNADSTVFTDVRDGHAYPVAKIKGKLWTAQNLRLEKLDGKIIGRTMQRVDGRVYNQAEAKQVCLNGWHLPSDAEWQTLIMPSKYLISKDWEKIRVETTYGRKHEGSSGIRVTYDRRGNAYYDTVQIGIDKYGFNALWGYYYYGENMTQIQGAVFWSSTFGGKEAPKGGSPFAFVIKEKESTYTMQHFADEEYSVRCITEPK